MVEDICCVVMYASTASEYASWFDSFTSGCARIMSFSALKSGSSVLDAPMLPLHAEDAERGHGVLSGEAQSAVARKVLREVIEPAMRHLLGTSSELAGPMASEEHPPLIDHREQ